MDKLLLDKAGEYLKSFKYPLDFDKLALQLKEISDINLALFNIKDKCEVSFDESKLFGKSGSVDGLHISFNKSRLKALFDLLIDDDGEGHLKRLNSFYRNYPRQNKHSQSEEMLFEFMTKYKQMDAEWAFEIMGSYKKVKFELLDTIFHETEHIYQKKYDKYLTGVTFPQDSKSKVMIFTQLFNNIYERLAKNKIEIDYKRDNHIFPIEFDARYVSMLKMSEIKNLLFPIDKLFAKYLVSSNIIPTKFNAHKTAGQILKDYHNLHKIYTENFDDEFEVANKFVCVNEKEIESTLESRYDKMLAIRDNNFVEEYSKS